MNYFDEIDAWLTKVLAAGAEEDEPEEKWSDRFKRQIKDKLLDSYRNGQKAGMPVRQGESGRHSPLFRRGKRH